MKSEQAFFTLAKAIRERGAPVCQETDPEIFFPLVGDAYGDTRQAKKLCSTCPVKEECLQFALANNEAFGIWGGLAPRERMALKAQSVGRPKKSA